MLGCSKAFTPDTVSGTYILRKVNGADLPSSSTDMGVTTTIISGGATLSVPRATVSIVGSVQPEVLASVLSGEHMSNGLAARLLFVMPPVAPALWTDNPISGELRGRWAHILEGLQRLRADDGPEPPERRPDEPA